MTVLRAALDDSAVAEASFSLRTTVDSANSEYISAYIDDLARRAWLVNDRVSFSLIPARSWSDGVSAVQPMSGEYAAKEAEWLRRMCRSGLRISALPSTVHDVVSSAVSGPAETTGEGATGPGGPCVFLPVCGGSCPNLWHDGPPPCPSYKFNIQARLDLTAETSGLRPVAPPRLMPNG
jgi:uncharacterized protein